MVGFILLPLTLLLVVVSSITVPTVLATVVIAVGVLMDAYRSRGRLDGIRAILPEVVRISKGREGHFHIQVENERLKVKSIKLGLAFPPGIYTPTVELRIELPEDNPISSVEWLLQGLKQGRYALDTYYLETASSWGLSLIHI